MKYDVVIGNPPYQGKSMGHHLWPKFINKSLSQLKESGWLAYITPDKWVYPIDGTATNVNEVISGNNLTVVKNTDIHFNIGESTSYFILSKEPYKGYTDCDKPKEIKYDIWDKMKYKNTRLRDKMLYFKHPEYHVTFKPDRSDEYSVQIYHGAKALWGKPSDCKGHHNTHKVMITGSGYYNVIVDDEPSIGHHLTMNIFCDSYEHQMKMAKWFDNPIHHTMIKDLKTGGFHWKLLYDMEYPTEEMLEMDPYKYYNLTQEEIEYVRSLQETR